MKRLQAGVGHDAVRGFKIGKNKRFLCGFKLPEGFLKFLAGVHADFGANQQNKQVGGLNLFVVFALRAFSRHACGKVFPNIQVQKNTPVKPRFAFAVDVDFKLLPFSFDYFASYMYEWIPLVYSETNAKTRTQTHNTFLSLIWY